ncbi:CBS domain-containing protein [Mobilitalea sibirica]|uniref:CBS domain-containing protein n=1 Tax=Mobilitalea sibirica TaxID=1462919 RepID=A0A8J7H957_9FIRM|nr:CBS domain-containing protein [Mobilitalea sibirica]MBH1940805.1 CBS domain-containing protein [Mobilitalea sibirica]
MKVRDIMSKDIASLRSDDTIERAAQLMKQYDCGSIPVCTNDKVIGIVTDRDIAVRSVASGQDNHQRVGDVMTTNLVVGSPEMDVRDAARLMSDRQIRRLPIIENNSLVGIVALGDISLEPSEQNSAEQALKNISEPGGHIR